MTSELPTLVQIFDDELFPVVDAKLRAGVHISRDELAEFAFLEDARPILAGFYDRYGCELCAEPEGFYYLLPRGDQLGQRHLSAAEMLVGQVLCLLHLDPATLRTGGRTTHDEVLQRLDALVGAERLGEVLFQGRSRARHRLEAEVRKAVRGALRRLERLGFVLSDKDGLRLKPSLMRFAEPVMRAEDLDDALTRLVADGRIVLSGSDDDDDDDQDEDAP